MLIYVGYAVFDYATPLFMSIDKEQVKKALSLLASIGKHTYIVEYKLNKDELIEFDDE